MQNKGLNTDFSPLLQPEGTYTYALNAVNQTNTGDFGFLSKEMSNEYIDTLPEGYIVLGSVHLNNNDELLFLTFDGISEIGILNEKEIYTQILNTRVLNFSEKYPIRSVFRLRKNEERVVYFVDGLNKPKSINLDRLSNYYSTDFREWLDLGNLEKDYIGEKWSSLKFNLVKSYNVIPDFNGIEILPSGNVKPGSYSFGIIYVDEDTNSTNVVTTSNSVNIYNDPLNREFSNIRGSRNVTSAVMSYSPTDKAIKVSVGNLDTSYPFYRLVIIQSNNMTGIANKAYLSEILSINQSDYIYYGNDESLTSIPLESVSIDKQDIETVEFIEQLENRLILGKYKTKNINFVEFQTSASKIRSHLTTKKVYLNTIKGTGNPKNPLSTFDSVGYMPGEVYSFGINYVFNDGSISPTYHIPGRNKKELRESVDGFNDNMDYYETPYSKYPEIHSYINRNNYWGKDSYGSYLTGSAKRHHKFPTRKDRGISLYEKEESSVNIYSYKLEIKITLKSGKTYPINKITNEPIIIGCNVSYKKANSTSYNEFSTLLTSNVTIETFIDQVYKGDVELQILDSGVQGIISGEILTHIDLFNIEFIYTPILEETLNPAYYTNIYGIRFDNIEKPHPDVVGYFITRNERLDSDKLIIDNALFGPLTKYDTGSTDYRVFNKWINKATLDNESIYFFSPEFQFKHDTLNFDHIQIDGYYNTSITTSRNAGEPADTEGDYDINEYGVVVSDIMEGTSYNPDVHADSDDDGFNLLVGYRNSNLTYDNKTADIKWSYDEDNNSAIENIMYIGAANSKFYNGKTFYNACQDNKIGIIKFSEGNEIDTALFNGGTRLFYGSLISNNESAYTNFVDRDYYKEHNNIIYFDSDDLGNSVSVFNGDAYVNACSPIASTYFGMIMADRKKKDKKSSGILGVALIVVGVVATIFTAGAAIGVFAALSTAATIGITAVAALALSAGASMYGSYLELEALKKMISEDYPNGLDQGIRDSDMTDDDKCNLDAGTKNTDDCIAWFSDRLTDLVIESSVNMGLRSSLNSIGIDFVNSFSKSGYDINEYRAYLTEKLTLVDPERGDGRIYRGFANTEWYDVNPDYTKINREKIFIHLPMTYDGRGTDGDYSEKYNNRLLYSQQSFQEEQTDNYRVFLVNNYKDFDGEHGVITGLFRLKNSIYIHTSEGLWFLPQNIQEKVTSELVTYIGTGEFLAIPPKKIEEGITNFGSQTDFATIFVKGGVIFINQRVNKIYYFTGTEAVEISEKGMRNWFLNNLSLNIKSQLYNLSEYRWRINNPSIGCGVLSGYDPKLNRLLVTKKDYEFTNLVNYVGEFSYDKTDYITGDVYINDNIFNIVDKAEYKLIKDLSLDNFVEDKDVTLSNVDINKILVSEKNIVGRWFNKNILTYKTIDYSNPYYIETNTNEINWDNLLINRPNGLNSTYINGYFSTTFIPKETKDYTFFTKSDDGSRLYIDTIVGGVVVPDLVVDNWYDQAATFRIGTRNLIANKEYTIRIEFYQGTGSASLLAGITSISDEGAIIEKYDTGYIKYIPPTDFEGIDYFKVKTDKTIYTEEEETIAIIVKDVDGSTESFPYELDPPITSYPVPLYKEIINFPITASGDLLIRDRITVPHKFTIFYTDNQKFVFDKTTYWDADINEEDIRHIVYEAGENVLKIIIECDWINPLNNSDYIKEINYEFEYYLA